jgi:hypothetical protein
MLRKENLIFRKHIVEAINSVAGEVLTGHDRRATWGANRVVDVAVLEEHPLAGEPVQMRSRQPLVAVAPE